MITEDQLEKANELISQRDELISLIHSIDGSKQTKLQIREPKDDSNYTSFSDIEKPLEEAFEAATKTFITSLKKSLDKINKDLAKLIEPSPL